MLEGNASRVYGRMIVGDASKWSVVKATLTAEYAIPRQEAWRWFTDLRLEDEGFLDVYLDALERLGTRVGMKPEDLPFRIKFYEGLPSSVYGWAVMRDGAYTDSFASVVVPRIRDRLAARRSVTKRAPRKVAPVKDLAASAGQGAGKSKVTCYRCGGPHRVKACPQRTRPSSGASGAASGQVRC